MLIEQEQKGEKKNVKSSQLYLYCTKSQQKLFLGTYILLDHSINRDPTFLHEQALSDKGKEKVSFNRKNP